MRTPTNPPPNKQNKVHNITNPNTKVPITNPPQQTKTKKRNNKEPIH